MNINVNAEIDKMKRLRNLLFCIILMSSCKKDNSDQNNSSVCFEITYLNSNIQDRLLSVFFLNGKDGYVTSHNGGIYRTIDSAKTWAILNSSTSLPIRDIYFSNANNGIAVGGLSSCSGTGCIPPGGFILSTQDGGQTWNQVFSPSNKLEINSISFVNNLLGFCVGDNAIFKTIDGGQSWSEEQISNPGSKMMKIKFIDQQNGFILCSFNKILKTADGGNTWKIIIPNTNANYYSLSSSNGTIFLSGQGKMLKSVDNGNNWNELANSPNDIYDIHFTSPNIGYAFGRGNYSGGDFGHSFGAMYCTDNGGNSWNGNRNFQDVGSIQAVSFPLSKIGYAVSGNKIIRITIN